MKFEAVDGTEARRIIPLVHRDDRGWFHRTWCRDTMRSAGIEFDPVQGNASRTLKAGTIRGMHFQREPNPDAKIVRISRGRVFDVIIDLRPGSPDFGRWHSLELSEDNGAMLYIPPGFAHGFQTLTDDVCAEYLMGERYIPDLYDGFRYDDPAVAIAWPLTPVGFSDKDLAWPPLTGRVAGLFPGRRP
jgi:dTDP-4-dehydrorhamnose 3,5-epimerase